MWVIIGIAAAVVILAIAAFVLGISDLAKPRRHGHPWRPR